MKKSIYICCLLPLLLLVHAEVKGQAFYGHQILGRHTLFFSLSYDGETRFGLGYYLRGRGLPFTDYGLEWRFPFTEPFSTQNYDLIAGAYRPINLTRRPFMGAGGYGILRSQEEKKELSLQITAIPSYTYGNVTGEPPHGTLGLIISYELVVLRQIRGEEVLYLPAQGLQLGGHADIYLERTLGLSTNGIYGRRWKIKAEELSPEEESWSGRGNLYWGASYNLRRW